MNKRTVKRNIFYSLFLGYISALSVVFKSSVFCPKTVVSCGGNRWFPLKFN